MVVVTLLGTKLLELSYSKNRLLFLLGNIVVRKGRPTVVN